MLSPFAVDQAKYFAIGAHGQQRRKYTNDPYWFHLNKVSEILTLHCRNITTEMLQAAWLHDVVEDTGFTIWDIKDHFGLDVFEYVRLLTEPPHSFGNRAARKAFYTEALRNASPEVQTIKYADLIDNTSSIVNYDPKFAKVYLKEKRDLLAVMNKGDQKLYEWACKLAETPE